VDQPTAKVVLSAYRAGAPDAEDPVFADALREVARDAELRAWLQEEQRFDAQVAETLREVPTPEGLKELILVNARGPRTVVPFAEEASAAHRRPVATWLAVAAGLVLAFILGRETLPGGSPPAEAPPRAIVGHGADRLALQAISYSGKMPALQFVCFDSALVARWINQKSVALQMGKVVDKPLATLQMIGSSAAEWEGKPVMMIALQNGREMAMLYLVRAADFPEAAAAAGGVMEKDGWVSETGRRGDHLFVLTTKGTRKSLDFPMPL
jgi:hypothetical protein